MLSTKTSGKVKPGKRVSQVRNLQEEKPNPFPGLRPFRYEESHLFFGREGQIDEVLRKLVDHRFVGVIGTSGMKYIVSGKIQ